MDQNMATFLAKIRARWAAKYKCLFFKKGQDTFWRGYLGRKWMCGGQGNKVNDMVNE